MTVSRIPLALLHPEHVPEHLEVVRHLVAGADLPADRGALLYVASERDRLRLGERLPEGGFRASGGSPEPSDLAAILGQVLLVMQLGRVAIDQVFEVRRQLRRTAPFRTLSGPGG